MTVKEACATIEEECKIDLSWNNYAIDFDRNNGLMVDAYGDYIVEQIHFCKTEELKVELIIEAIPRKKQS